MPVPFPDPDDTELSRPDADEAEFLTQGVVSAVTPPGGLTRLQDALIRATFHSLVDHDVDPLEAPAIDPTTFAEGLARRNARFRMRVVQTMMLAELVLVPLPPEVAERVEAFASELGIDDAMLHVARRLSQGSLGLALIDFERNGYTATWDPSRSAHLHTATALDLAWQEACHDPDLAARWAGLEHCPAGSLGRGVFDFYRARGFTFPGLPGSAPPYLAQHDWVHVLADYGSTVESEIEMFGLIARAIEEPRGFSLLAMVIGLFETGYLPRQAGLFLADRGHLSREGMAIRLADAMRRGAPHGGARSRRGRRPHDHRLVRVGEDPDRRGARSVRRHPEVARGGGRRIGRSVGAGRHQLSPVVLRPGAGRRRRAPLRPRRRLSSVMERWWASGHDGRRPDR